MLPGDEVHVAMTKWGDRPHWEFPALYLGEDRHGQWLGIAAGTKVRRPGAEWFPPTPQVNLVPRTDRGAEGAWVATFSGDDEPYFVYVDVTTPPIWDASTLRAVDLDLDVAKRSGEPAFVDDEDEFAEHRVRYGYPAEVVALAEDSAAWLYDAVTAGAEPFDPHTSRAWLARLTDVLDQ